MATDAVMLGRVSRCFTVIAPEMSAAKRHTEDAAAATAIGNNTRNAVRRRRERTGTRHPTLSVIGNKARNSRGKRGIFRSAPRGYSDDPQKRTIPTLVRIRFEIALTLVNGGLAVR